jgi:hypothetical protein
MPLDHCKEKRFGDIVKSSAYERNGAKSSLSVSVGGEVVVMRNRGVNDILYKLRWEE